MKMKRRTFLRNVAAIAAAPTAIAEAAFRQPAPAQGKTEWQMITQFRVNPLQREFARIITEASDGQLQIRLSSRGLKPPSKVIEDVNSGKIEMVWGGFLNSPPEEEEASQSQKVSAADFLIMPFGLTAQEYNGWIECGGGQELVERIYEQIGCKYFPAGNTGIQMGGWYAKEIKTIDDLKGLKIRISGFGAAVMKAVGAEPYDVAPWSHDAQRALMEGDLDAFERGGPASDLTAGIHKHGKYKYYYYPDWHEPSVPKALLINRVKWDTLPSHLQTVISTAATWLNYQMLVDRTAVNSAALASLVQEHGVQIRRFPETVLETLAKVSDQILRERASQDKLSQEVFNSIMAFRQKVSPWAMVSLQPFLRARGALQ
jgi:TRAP-type mannitol/chloroaromatic compound transport system substrate-binding protein